MNRATEAPPIPTPPRPDRRPHRLEKHASVRSDDYYWLRDRDDPGVIAHLHAENAYTKAKLRHTEDLQQTIFDEIVARIPQQDESVPWRLNGYWYHHRFETGREYPVHLRRPDSPDAPAEVMLDVNELAAGHQYYSVGALAVSSGNDTLAFAVDTVGRRFYEIRFRNLDTGEILDEVIPATTGNIAWASDNRTLFYSRQNPDTLRWDRIYRHTLGTDVGDDVLVYEETDETFSTFVFTTRSRRFIVIGSSQTLTDEYRYLDASDPAGELRILEPRDRGHEYSVEHFGDHFYIRTNWDAQNFRVMKAPVEAPGRENWVEVIPHRQGTLVEDIEVFRDHLVIAERTDGLTRLRIRGWEGDEDHEIDLHEPAYVAFLGENPELDTEKLRFNYSSMTTPWSVYEWDMQARTKTLLKRDEVGGGFDCKRYVTERLWATARDGTRIPVSILYREGLEPDGTNPLLLYGYGSYGLSMDPDFGSPRLSLVDRGFVYAIAHIRGGQELGREWYESGKLLSKKNTFTDFIDVAEFLVAERWADPERLFALGGSAGGLLVGAVLNMRPDLWKAAVASVPFVDVVTTMLDPSIPLTTGEYDEWGNPNERAFFHYILSYSPYDNVRAQDYPALLVMSGLHDSQVQFWEPTKWVLRLRDLKTDENDVLLHTNMEAGHSGTTGRFRRHRETALMYAFLLDQAGLAGTGPTFD